ncbi:SprT family zinc-dependent metalloprotease [Thiomicrorhabdus sp. ZW0627]|uniref:M48 family metallopeptidase n=1 Tax=Thiomicrorhabdus sp. ZW0627 TaxID=3039774 RepID=UPI002436EE0A|nr:SprT family zinc-dependent metalloprotease [Thiomicrorhabdus sp. ZW0627]MDG6773991.1 SprT family zinc-dependent metalloprotease [Thiomicrorhabdus sp. ZW0627]
MLNKLLKTQPVNSFTAGEHELPVVKTARKKSIALKHTSSGIELHVPRHLSERALNKLLQHHSQWIARKVQTLQSRPLEGFKAQPGETVLFHGEAYELQFSEADVSENRAVSSRRRKSKLQCRLQDGAFYLHGIAENVDTESETFLTDIKGAIQHWFIEQSHAYIEPRMESYARQIGVQPKSVTVKTYKSRWGSCYPDGRIQFNWKLMQAPEWVVDYVIVHELCHLVHANHSRNFWQLVERHYPQTPQAKRWIKQHGGQLIQFLS